jgi:hypothetical protein|nr:MAG TPA: metallophosphatase domain protein [Caudoviricetes sp.]
MAVELISEIIQKNGQDFALVDANNIRGGFYQVTTMDERNAIPDKRKKNGMLCFVLNDPDKVFTYQWLNGYWIKAQLGGGGGGEGDSRVEIVSTPEELANRTDLERAGQIVYVESTDEVVFWSNKEVWSSFDHVRIQEEEPTDKNVLWVDVSDKSIPEYNNEDLKAIIEAVNEIRKLVNKHEYAFTHEMVCGGFTDSAREAMMAAAEPVEPDTDDTATTLVEEYPDYAEYETPNVKHIAVKAGTYAELLDNKQNYIDNELLWCTDTKQLYIMNNGTLNWVNKASGSGGGTEWDPSVLDQLDTIGFVTPSGQTYRIKLNDGGEMVIYKKELDTPQSEPQGGQTDPSTGWVYVTSLFLQKLYINSIYCGGLTADEHSYNYCSHHFVELSNLTTEDINLNGLSLQYSSEGTQWQVLPLWGTIKAGSTFLIRGAQCSVMDANTTKIKVKTYDMEWKDSSGNLIKFDNTKAKFYLTWGTTPSSVKNPYSNTDGNYRVSKGYIDLVGFNKENAESLDTIDASENKPYAYLSTDKLFTKYYAMDPVSQATKALSARNNANDWYFVDLTKELVPSVEAFTPRASFENKTIFYNKSKLVNLKPNLISCTFGRQATAPDASRCFNWVSVGYFDEYLWHRPKGETDDGPWVKVESFKNETGVRKYYNRIRMEATDGTPFTTHKVILQHLGVGTYEYRVGRADANGNPSEFASDSYTFTVRGTDDVKDDFTFVQVSDQQGFNWDEYRVWNIAADYIKNHVPECQFTVNTGDMTQNGNRINEWVDYYNSRKSLWGVEEMVTVGNNDLCPANMYILGNGGDSSKINPSNMSFFYTFEFDETNPPVFTIEGKEVFIDSLYSFTYGNVHFMCVNSEITEMTETNIYGLSTGKITYPYIKQWCQNDIERASSATWQIAYCHEMPFTIITQNVIQQFYWNNTENSKVERSGSHLNYNVPDSDKYWFSKFCQENNIRLVMGGHKHTYSVSWPLLENFKEDGTPNSMKPIIQVTQSDLTTYFNSDSLYEETEGDLKGQKFPSAWKTDENFKQHKHLCTFELVEKITAPVYAMCQATGYKHTSNKELPAPNIPWLRNYFPATVKVVDQTNITATVNAGQRYPFYIIWNITPTRITGTVKKLNYVFTSAGKFNINIQSSVNPPEAIGGNGETNNGNDLIIIDA